LSLHGLDYLVLDLIGNDIDGNGRYDTETGINRIISLALGKHRYLEDFSPFPCLSSSKNDYRRNGDRDYRDGDLNSWFWHYQSMFTWKSINGRTKKTSDMNFVSYMDIIKQDIR